MLPGCMDALIISYLMLGLSLLANSVTHERNLVWAQKDITSKTAVARIVGVSGDPGDWVVNRTATTRYITAPNPNWRFEALAMDYHRKTLYWSDTGNKKIQGLTLDGSNTAFLAHSGCSSEVKGVAVDWTTSVIYWTDALYNWILATSTRRQDDLAVKIVDSDLDDPGGLVVLPQNGLLFWTNSGEEPKVERATCAGSDRKAIVTSDLSHPTGLVLHPAGHTLYFLDSGRGVIESIDVNGSNRQKLFTVENSQFFGIAIYEPFLFVTDQSDSQLYVFNVVTREHEVNFKVNSRPYDVLMYDEEQQQLTSSDCNEANCDHLCVNLPSNSHQCLCYAGHILSDDLSTCLRDRKFVQPQFIYTIGSALCSFPGNLADMSLQNVSLDTQCFLTHRQVALALTTDVRNGLLYFSENKTKTISRLKLSDNIHSEAEIIIGGTGTVEGLALDWLTGNLYWTDSLLRHIMVSRSDGSYQRELVHSDLTHPYGIAVDALNSYLYWGDLGGRVERSYLDGSHREVVASNNISQPRQLVIDYHQNQLCWCDSELGVVECLSLSTFLRTIIMAQQDTNMHGLTIFQDYLVWTDQDERNGIHAGIKKTGEKIRGVIHPGIGQAYDVITFDASLQPYASDPCSDGNGNCEHLCFSQPDNTHVCACAMGFSMDPHTSLCQADSLSDHFAVFTDTYQKQIYQMALDSGDFQAVPLSSHENPIAVDYDSVEQRLYWTDVYAHVIKRSYLNGTGEDIVRQLTNDSIPDGLAVEPLSRLVFYTDTGLKVIEAMTLDGRHHRALIAQGLDQPRAIVLDPTRGLMFWTDWGLHSRIERANMDGRERAKIVDTGLGAWPNGLAIDILSGRLYWCDARADKIESSDLYGRSRTLLYEDQGSHFFGLSITAGVIFYTDWTKKSVMKLTPGGKGDMHSTSLGTPSFSRLNDIHVYRSSHSLDAFQKTACSLGNGGCSYMCIAVPKGRTCVCPDNLSIHDAAMCELSSGLDAKSLITLTTKPDIVKMSTHTMLSPAGTDVPETAETRTKIHTLSTTRLTLTTLTTHALTTQLSTTQPSTTQSTTLPSTTQLSTQPSTSAPHQPHTTTSSSSTHSTTVWVTIPPLTTTTVQPRTTTKNMPPTSRTERSTLPSTLKTERTSETSTTIKPRKTTPALLTSEKARFPWLRGTTISSTAQGSGLVTMVSVTVPVTQSPTTPAVGVPHKTQPPHPPPRRPNTTAAPRTTTVIVTTTSNDDFGVSMFALMAIIIGGIVLMCLIIVTGIILYRKMDPDRAHGRRGEAALSSISDIYELPQAAGKTAAVNGPHCRYASLQEQFYTGEMDAGLENPSFSPRDMVNTYEEILEESERHPTFSTFR